MNRFLRQARLALVVLVLPLLACDPSWLTVIIPDFTSKEIEGVWIWRLAGHSGQYQRYALIRFDGVMTAPQGPLLTYSSYSTSGQDSLNAVVTVDPWDADVVVLTLGFERGAPGVFKVTTFNAAGESPLSAASVNL
jgi:hypothetical protein